MEEMETLQCVSQCFRHWLLSAPSLVQMLSTLDPSELGAAEILFPSVLQIAVAKKALSRALLPSFHCSRVGSQSKP